MTSDLFAFYWAAREGKAQSRNEKHVLSMSKKRQRGRRKSWRVLSVPLPLQWGRSFRGGDGPFHVVWPTALEVYLHRTQNYCVELLALYLCRIIIKIQSSDEVVSLLGSCRSYALTRSPREKLQLLQFSPWVWQVSPYKKRICYLWIASSNKNIFTWIVRKALNTISNRNKTET